MAQGDLVCYCSANMPNSDSGTSGGAIDADYRVVFTQPTTTDNIEVVSSSASDTTQQVTIRGRKTDGTAAEQTVTLTGTTPVVASTLGDVVRVLKVSMDSDAVGVVTVRRDGAAGDIATIPIGERGFMAFHREATASDSADTYFYYKIFVKNTSGSDTISSCQVTQSSDPLNRVTFALAASINDSGSTTDRTTDPSLTFNDDMKLVPGGSLTPADAIGVWLKVTHPQGEVDTSSLFTLGFDGTW